MMEWVNPHSWLHIDVKKPDGSVERWKIEGGSPSVLMRLGWNRNSLPVGTRVTVVGFQAKDGSLRASSRDLRFPDGRRMDLGGSGSTTSDQKKSTFSLPVLSDDGVAAATLRFGAGEKRLSARVLTTTSTVLAQRMRGGSQVRPVNRRDRRPFQIFQRDGDLLMVYPFAAANRVIYMTDRSELPVSATKDQKK